MSQKIIFIGGAPTVGKTTIAQTLSRKLSLPWVSTDQIRSVMQSVANRDAYPALFNAADYDAERFLTELTAEQIVTLEMEQADEVWIGVRAFVNDWSWKEGGIVEGVNILPRLVAGTYKDTGAKAIFLCDHNEDHIREIVYTRGLWAHAGTYPDSVKEKEVEWALLYGRQLEEQAASFGYECVEISKGDGDIDRVLEAVQRSPRV